MYLYWNWIYILLPRQILPAVKVRAIWWGKETCFFERQSIFWWNIENCRILILYVLLSFQVDLHLFLPLLNRSFVGWNIAVINFARCTKPSQIGIEFYLVVLKRQRVHVYISYWAKRFSKFTRQSVVFHNTMRKKQVESNPYIYTLSKLFRFLAMKYKFLIHNRVVFRTAAGATVSYAKGTVSQKNEFQINSYVHSNRNHWKCKYIFHGLTCLLN